MEITDKYKRAYVEVLEIIKYLPEDEYLRIPKEQIEFFNNNKDKNYKFKINPNIDLKQQNISKEAGALLIILFRDYFASEEQKEKIKILTDKEKQKIENELREKYNPNDLFKNKGENSFQNITDNNSNPKVSKLPTEYKEKFLKRFINYIKRIIKILNRKM